MGQAWAPGERGRHEEGHRVGRGFSLPWGFPGAVVHGRVGAAARSGESSVGASAPALGGGPPGGRAPRREAAASSGSGRPAPASFSAAEPPGWGLCLRGGAAGARGRGGVSPHVPLPPAHPPTRGGAAGLSPRSGRGRGGWSHVAAGPASGTLAAPAGVGCGARLRGQPRVVSRSAAKPSEQQGCGGASPRHTQGSGAKPRFREGVGEQPRLTPPPASSTAAPPSPPSAPPPASPARTARPPPPASPPGRTCPCPRPAARPRARRR